MRIVIAQLNYKLGDFSGNFEKIAAVVKEQGNQTDLIIFTELALSGYFPRDLILRPGFVQAQNNYLNQLGSLTQNCHAALVVGFISHNQEKGKAFHNSLCLLQNGQRLYTYHKKLLPVYNIFDEARYFAPGKTSGIFEFQNQKIGFLICEDGWSDLEDFLYDANPVDNLAAKNLDLIICINGSPSNVGKQEERIKHFSAIAKKCAAPLIFTNQVGGQDDIIFDGNSFVIDKTGNVLGHLTPFTEKVGILSLDKIPLLSSDFSPYQPLPLHALFYQQILLGLKDYVKKCGFKQVVIGLSGGIDSALTLALAVKALGEDNVTALLMPSRYNAQQSLDDAKQICQNLEVKYYIISIQEELDLVENQFKQTYQVNPSALTAQNIQARIRGRLLMEYSNQTGALVLSTGNKSELSTGYTTLYGDMTGGFNLIGDLYKTEVYALARYFNQLFPQTPIPPSILEKEPSAELAFNQKDSDTLPPYDILDPILRLYLEGDLLPASELAHYQSQTQTLPPALIKKVHQMVDKAEFKRQQAPPIIRLQRRAFGRGRQFPIAYRFDET